MNFSFLTDPRYDILGAFWMTVQLTFWSAIGSFILGVILVAMRVSPVPLMRGFASGFVNIIRNIPLTLIIIMMSQVVANQLGLRLAVREAGVNPQAFLDSQNFRLAVLGLHHLHLDVRLRGHPVRHQHRAARAGRGGPGDRPEVHPGAGHRRAAAGHPGGDRPAGLGADRADQEHHDRLRHRRGRGGRR